MTPSFARPALVTLIGSLLVMATASAQTAEVEYRDGRGRVKTETGTITDHTYRGLKLKVRRTGVERTISDDDVLRLAYERAPEKYDEAQGYERDGDYRAAFEAYRELIDDERLSRSRSKWAKENTLYGLWLNGRRARFFDDAQQFEAQLRKDFPQSHWLPNLEIQAAWDIYGKGDFKGAAKAFAKVQSQGKTRAYASQYLFRAGAGHVRSLLAAKQVGEAKSAATSLEGGANSDSLRLQARAVNGYVLLAEKNYDGARRQFAGVLDGIDYKRDAAAFAMAANGLGEVAFATKDYEQASLDFSKTFALCAGHDGLDESVGWAHWRFSNSSKQLLGKASDEDVRRRWGARWQSNRRRAAEFYPLTRGGQLALSAMGAGSK